VAGEWPSRTSVFNGTAVLPGGAVGPASRLVRAALGGGSGPTLGLSAASGDPMGPLARGPEHGTISVMQVITLPGSRPAPPSRAAIVVGSTVGVVLVVGGALVAWLAFTTPLISRLMPVGRADTTEMITGAVAWGFAFVAPGAFLIAGIARIAKIVEGVTDARPPATPAVRLARQLPDDLVVVPRIRLPEGRTIPELVIGPFGAAVIAKLPPVGATRRHGSAWEVRAGHGRWIPLEDPLVRAARDAERIRTWFAHDDRDFVVRVHAAVVAPDTSLPRTAACAVITQDQIPAWLSSLPAQRSLTASRREHLLDLIRELG